MSKKKILSLLAVLVMVISLVAVAVSVNASAADESSATINYESLIPEEYADTSKYPFAFFDADLNLIHVGKLSAFTKDYSQYVGLTAYLRTDYTIATKINPVYINGTFTIDLGGHTLSRNAQYLFDIVAYDDHAYESNIVVKNGTLNSVAKWFIAFNNSRMITAHKQMNFTFSDVTFKYNSTSANASGAFVSCWENSSVADSNYYGINANLVFNDCIYDFTNAPKNATMFDFVSSDKTDETDIIATFNGGTIIGCNNSTAKLTYKLYNADLSEAKNATDGGDTGNAIYIKEGSDGKFMTFKVNSAASDYQPKSTTQTFPTTDNGTYYLLPTSGNASKAVCEYTFINDKNAFPMEVFDANGKSVGKYLTWIEATAKLISIGSGAKIVLHDDVVVLSNGNVGSAVGDPAKEYTIDLNGHTLSRENNSYVLSTYFANTVAQSGKITVENGTIKKIANANKFGLISLNYSKAEEKNTVAPVLDFEFNNVDFINERSDDFIFTLFEDGKDMATAMGSKTLAVFNDCSFTYKGGPVFELNHSSGSSKTDIDVVVNGGSFYPSASATTTELFTKDSDDTFTFGKNAAGEYSKFVVPTGSAFASTLYNNDTLAFVKVEEGTKTTTYSLAEVGFKNYAPQMSLTLDSDLVANVYIPVIGTQSFTFDGVNSTENAELAANIVDFGGVSYYLVSVALPASEAARTLTLTANVAFGDTSANGTFTFSLAKYAEKLLASDATDAEKAVVQSALAYVKAAYLYWNKTNLTDFDALLNGYEANLTVEGDTAVPTNGLVGATLVLNATPAIRFFLPEEADAAAYTFKQGGRALETTVGTGVVDGKTYTTIDISVYAYRMCDTITYYVNGVEMGAYHINAYYAFAENDANLKAIVEAFWSYCQSARAYKLAYEA